MATLKNSHLLGESSYRSSDLHSANPLIDFHTVQKQGDVTE